MPPSCCEQEEPTYFAIWGDNKAFNEVIISPAMLHEHLPYVVMEGLNKVSPRAAWAMTPHQSPAVLCGLGLRPRMTGKGADARRSESELLFWSPHPCCPRGHVGPMVGRGLGDSQGPGPLQTYSRAGAPSAVTWPWKGWP